MLEHRRLHAQQQRQHVHRPQNTELRKGMTSIVLRDDYDFVTAMELTVALSMVTGVEEQNIHVHVRKDSLFDVTIEGEGDSIAHTMNTDSFIVSLNEMVADFGAKMVVFRAALGVWENVTVL